MSRKHEDETLKDQEHVGSTDPKEEAVGKAHSDADPQRGKPAKGSEEDVEAEDTKVENKGCDACRNTGLNGDKRCSACNGSPFGESGEEKEEVDAKTTE